MAVEKLIIPHITLKRNTKVKKVTHIWLPLLSNRKPQ